MKISTLLIFITSFNLLAESGYSQDKEISLKLAKTYTIENVISEIEKTTDYVFIYNEDVIPTLKQEVKDDINAQSLDEILNQLIKGTDLGYSLSSKQITLYKDRSKKEYAQVTSSAPLVLQQPSGKTITGRVTDSNGETLPGVTILIKGTSKGTISDIDGNYTLTDVSENNILQFSYMGMQTQDIVIGSRIKIDVTMTEDAIGLEEIVAVGYGTQRVREVTSSISHLSEKDFPQVAAYQSPLQLLSGKIAGLAVSRSGGGDPSSGVDIQLRGVGSIRGSTAPLIVVDGVIGGSLSTIPPESIESISVLRDGSAAAIYGTRANAGVIIISTKRGIPGSPKISYSTYFYTERYANKPDLLSGEQYRNIKKEWTNSEESFLKSIANTMIDYGHNTDWFDEISQNAFSQVHNLSISGGSESTRFFGAFNYREQNGLIKRTGKNELSGKLSLSHTELDGRLKVDFSLSNTFITARPFDGLIMYQAYRKNPTMPVYNIDPSLESYLTDPEGKLFEIPGHREQNPVGLIENYERENKSSVFLGSGKVSYELINGLVGSVMGAYQRINGTNNFYESKYSWDSMNATGANGSASKSSSLSEVRTLETTLNYDINLGANHNISSLAGYSFQEDISENFSAANRTFLSDFFGTDNLGAGLQISRGAFTNPVSSSKGSSKLIAGFVRINYNYDSKYMVSASLRREGSTKFGIDNKWGNFPAISAGWLINEEDFMKSTNNYINNLKLRVGYGVTGNQGIPNYLSLSRLSPTGYMLYQNEWIPGYSPASNPNPNLKWETKAETNIGIEATIFNNISMTVDLYNRTTKDLLFEYRVPVPPNIYERTWANVGSINNKGIEFSINANPISTTDFSWVTGFNISYNKNKLLSLSDDLYEQSDLRLAMPNAGPLGLSDEVIYRVEEGEAIGNIYTWAHAGFSEDGKWLVWDETNTKKIHPNEASYEDRRVTGNGVPKSWVGFNNTFTYKNIDLQVSFKGALGFEMLNAIHLHRAYPGMLPNNTFTKALNDPVLSKIRDQRNFLDSYWVEPGDYVKLENISLGYTIPLKGLKNLRIYVSGQNLLTLTKYKGEDPEHTIVGLIPSYDDYWNYPRTKTFSIGFNAEF